MPTPDTSWTLPGDVAKLSPLFYTLMMLHSNNLNMPGLSAFVLYYYKHMTYTF